MLRFVLLIAGVFGVGFLYSFLIQKITRNKIVLFLPSGIGIIWLVYTILTFSSDYSIGFDGIIIVLAGIIIAALVWGNVIGSIIFLRKKEPKIKI